MPLNRNNVRDLLQSFGFQRLFIEELGWSNPQSSKPVNLSVHGQEYLRRPIAQMSGVTVFEITSADPAHVGIPDAKERAAIHTTVAEFSHENLLIFLDNDKNRGQSLWYWVKRDGGKRLPREHLYLKGQPGDLFLSKLDSMVIELDELRADGTLPLVEVTQRLLNALDVERVTRRFYKEFSELRVEFIDQIEGIDHEADRFWYASVLLNRLMFIYFLQKRGFIQNNTHYLEDKFADSQQRGPDRFYPEFLQALFFEGFARPEPERSPAATALLGDVRYLNGGLFIRHPLELRYPRIVVSDAALEAVLTLFGHYSWHLDDTPGAADNEINPAVLGYIFEQYINQKAFGAYYTRSEITDYLCERTIHAVILERIHEHTARRFASLGEALLKLDVELCRILLALLPTITILDPACGSGAFLVAAMKTLLEVYAAVFGKIEMLNDLNLTQKVKEIRRSHPSVAYYIRKQIITNNLYGVDIMAEAVEIARLRLFLALVSAAQSETQLEPLPNIDFNIMAGNSLIGLMRVDGERFNRGQQGLLLQGAKAADYNQLLTEKNRLIDAYRNLSSPDFDLQALRDSIDAHKREAYSTLDTLLLYDFQELSIRYEQAQLTGKAKRRALTSDDIQDLQPFHWGYEFDRVMGEQDGFDVILTNPPWEIFKPNAKEFFAEFSDVVAKKKMDIKRFEKEQAHLLEDPEIATAWLDYLSGFPHVSAYFRNAPQFQNQVAVINGKKAGSDINLYKLFVEQCYNLLRDGGFCGIIVPSGIYTDLGAKQLREMLFSGSEIAALFGLSNERYIFENVHHAFKVSLLVFRKGGKTKSFEAAFRINPREAIGPEQLAIFLIDEHEHVQLSVPLIRRLSPDSLSVMEFKCDLDMQIAEKMLRFPLLGEQLEGTWNLKLSTEFHMTNDSHLFRTEPGPGRLPLYEGKMLHQFDAHFAAPKYWVDEREGRRALLGKVGDRGQLMDYQQYRLGIRAVASNTNERSLICTVVPHGVFAGNSVIVNKDNSLTAEQLLACTAIMNSLVADWLLRQKVTTNINMFYLYQLPVPRLEISKAMLSSIIQTAARLVCMYPEFSDLATAVGVDMQQDGVAPSADRTELRSDLDARIAHLYGLSEDEFVHILSSFPLVDQTTKDATLDAFRRLASHPDDTQLAKLVRNGEGPNLEFKAGAIFNPFTKKTDNSMKENLVQAVAAFLNSSGGALLLGVKDDGEVLGVEDDMRSADPHKPNRDGYELFLRNTLKSAYGAEFGHLYAFSFHTIDDRTVCRIKVEPSDQPVYVEGNMYIRSGNQKQKLTAQAAINYAQKHWKK